MNHLTIMSSIVIGIFLIAVMTDPTMQSCLETYSQQTCSHMLGR